MSYIFHGILEQIGDTEIKSDRFRAREFVVKSIEDTYPQTIKFQLTQHRCEMIDQFTCGEILDIKFVLSGREWNGRVFINLNVLAVDNISRKRNNVNRDSVIAPEFRNKEFDEIPFEDEVPF